MVTAYHLHFRSPVHVGIESIGQEKIEPLIRSDTLWGAIISKWLLLFDDNPSELCQDPNFCISSCFPLAARTRFYPVPIGALDHLMNEAARKTAGTEPTVKTIKKIRFLAEPLFEKVRSGYRLKLSDIGPENALPWEARSQKNVNTLAFSKEIQRPRIRTDQASGGVGEDSFFYCSDQFFPEGSGQFFLARFQDKEVRKKFEAALMLLGDSGIGADKSVGRGFFTFNSYELDMMKTNSGKTFLLLSLCIPTQQEVEKGLLEARDSRYSLVRRFGHAGSHGVNRLRRPDCWMIEEGSVFPVKPEGTIPKVIARAEDVPHDVYRYGKAFCISMES